MVQLFVSCVTAGVLSVNSEALRSRRSAARPLDDFVWSDLTASTASGTQPSQKISRRVLKAAWLAVPFRALAALAESASGEAEDDWGPKCSCRRNANGHPRCPD